jgi:hypothetical protein
VYAITKSVEANRQKVRFITRRTHSASEATMVPVFFKLPIRRA